MFHVHKVSASCGVIIEENYCWKRPTFAAVAEAPRVVTGSGWMEAWVMNEGMSDEWRHEWWMGDLGSGEEVDSPPYWIQERCIARLGWTMRFCWTKEQLNLETRVCFSSEWPSPKILLNPDVVKEHADLWAIFLLCNDVQQTQEGCCHSKGTHSCRRHMILVTISRVAGRVEVHLSSGGLTQATFGFLTCSH